MPENPKAKWIGKLSALIYQRQVICSSAKYPLFPPKN